MKWTTKLVLKIVYKLRFDDLFALCNPSYKLLKKLVPHPTYYKENDKIKVKRDATLFYINRSDWMQWHIYARIEDNAWQYALDYLDKLKKQNPIILDIGSNVGAFSFKLATNLSRRGISNYSIYAFDPNPYIKEIFERNLEVNYTISKHIHFFPLAISKFDGTSLFDFDKNNSGTGSISDRGFPVEVVRLDKFCETHNVNSIDFIKIDVEGFEPFVFSGARRVIEKFRPAIYAEISPRLYEAKGMSAREIFEYLVSVNYKLFKDSGNNLKVIDCNSYDSLFEETQFNIVAYPN